jgi:hypothetical protein
MYTCYNIQNLKVLKGEFIIGDDGTNRALSWSLLLGGIAKYVLKLSKKDGFHP